MLLALRFGIQNAVIIGFDIFRIKCVYIGHTFKTLKAHNDKRRRIKTRSKNKWKPESWN